MQKEKVSAGRTLQPQKYFIFCLLRLYTLRSVASEIEKYEKHYFIITLLIEELLIRTTCFEFLICNFATCILVRKMKAREARKY